MQVLQLVCQMKTIPNKVLKIPQSPRVRAKQQFVALHVRVFLNLQTPNQMSTSDRRGMVNLLRTFANLLPQAVHTLKDARNEAPQFQRKRCRAVVPSATLVCLWHCLISIWSQVWGLQRLKLSWPTKNSKVEKRDWLKRQPSNLQWATP